MTNYQNYIEYRGGKCKPDVSQHPCYSEQAHRKFGRVHLPVAPACNIQCNYCVRKYACPNENRPGVTVDVISPEQAIQTIHRALEIEPRIRVIGIAGPGDALANDATIATLEQARDIFPSMARCMSTNGLMLPDRIEELHRARVTALTVTVNAVDATIGTQIYRAVRYQGKTYRGREAFELLNAKQLDGIALAAERGMIVKVNSILMPGINDYHLVEVARAVRERGAYIMNIMPLIAVPGSQFAHMSPPSVDMLDRARAACQNVINQFRSCTQCRADAIGVPGEGSCGGDQLQTQITPLLEASFQPTRNRFAELLEDEEDDLVALPVKGAFRSGLF